MEDTYTTLCSSKKDKESYSSVHLWKQWPLGNLLWRFVECFYGRKDHTNSYIITEITVEVILIFLAIFNFQIFSDKCKLSYILNKACFFKKNKKINTSFTSKFVPLLSHKENYFLFSLQVEQWLWVYICFCSCVRQWDMRKLQAFLLRFIFVEKKKSPILYTKCFVRIN